MNPLTAVARVTAAAVFAGFAAYQALDWLRREWALLAQETIDRY